jgi:hypothetical protein
MGESRMGNKIKDILEKGNLGSHLCLSELYALACVEDFNSFCAFFLEEINDNTIEEISSYNELLHTFLYRLSDEVKSNDEVTQLKVLFKHIIKVTKDALKPYNKKEKELDNVYYELKKLEFNINSNCNYLDCLYYIKFENESAVVFDFLVNKIKNATAMYRIFESHPNLVNTKNIYGDSLLKIITDYYIKNIDKMKKEDITYYKRLMMMILENKSLIVIPSELSLIMTNVEYRLRSAKPEHKADLEFVGKVIETHCPMMDDVNVTAIDHSLEPSPVDIIIHDPDKRLDLRGLKTFTIDKVRNPEKIEHLFDDAFSISAGTDGYYYLYVHVADADSLIKRDSELDKHMRSIGDAINTSKYKRPILDYKIGNKISLHQGEDRNALTFYIKIDENGRIVNTKFFKSIINVDCNLSEGSANAIMHRKEDNRSSYLNLMYFVAKKLRRYSSIKKHDSRNKAHDIIDSFNFAPDIATAKYFKKNDIVFPYKNFEGKITDGSIYLSDIRNFEEERELSQLSHELILSLIEIRNRIDYDTICKGNSLYKGNPVGNVGNPLRQYISLETDRLIKDLVIDEKNNFSYWNERIEEDCIEYTETSAKIKELYKK